MDEITTSRGSRFGPTEEDIRRFSEYQREVTVLEARRRRQTTMDAFEVRRQLVADYAEYIREFIHIRDQSIRDHVRRGVARYLSVGPLETDLL